MNDSWPDDPTQANAPLTPPAGPSGNGRRSWHRWIVGGLVAIVLLLAAVIAGLLIGGDDDEIAASATSTSTTSTSTSTTAAPATTTTAAPVTTSTAAPATTVAPATTTTVAIPPVTADPAQCAAAGDDPIDPDSAAQAVFIAWTRGDEVCARELMTDEAFDELFARDGSAATAQFQFCQESGDGEPYMDCAFTYEGGATHYLLRYSEVQGWLVYDFTYFAD